MQNFIIPRNSHINSIFSILIIFLFTLFVKTSAETYYVNNKSPNASDTNKGTFDHPWATIHKANMKVAAGDTVIVMGGVYHDWIAPSACGEESNWIVYKSEPQYAAILDGMVNLSDAISDSASWVRDDYYGGNVWKIKLRTGAFYEAWKDGKRMPYPYPYPCDSLKFAEGRSFVDHSGYLFVWLPENDSPENHEWKVTLKSGVWVLADGGARDKYLIVEGFSVTNYGLAGIEVQKNHIRILNNKSFGNGRAGIGANFCNHVRVEGNEAYENCKWTGFSQGITAFGATGSDIYFIGNISHNNFDGDDSLHCGTDGCGFLLDTAEPRGGAHFVNNVAYNNQGSGFGVFESDNGIFVNNTSFNNGLKSIWVSECHVISTPEGTSNNLVFRNNIFAARPNHPYITSIIYSYVFPPENVLFDHNLYFAPDKDSSSEIVELTIKSCLGDTTLRFNLESLQSFRFPSDSAAIQLGWGEESIVGSPLLIDWRNGGFKVSSGSPAIDNGNSLGAPSVDYFNTPRPQGEGFDIGAYEYYNETGVESKSNPSVLDFSVYPNPFNGQVHINYSLPQKSKISIAVFDILGRKVLDLVQDEIGQGKHSIVWNGRNSSDMSAASGIYFICLKTDFSFAIKKIIYLK